MLPKKVRKNGAYQNLTSIYNIDLKRKITETKACLKVAQSKYIQAKQAIFLRKTVLHIST